MSFLWLGIAASGTRSICQCVAWCAKCRKVRTDAGYVFIQTGMSRTGGPWPCPCLSAVQSDLSLR